MRSGEKFTLYIFLILLFASNFASAMALRPCALVTGSTDGIGLTTAKNLAKQGYDVLIHGRDSLRIEKAEVSVRAFCGNDSGSGRVFSLPPADLSTVSESSQFAKDVTRLCQEHDLKLSVLMNNAGVYSESLVLTKDNLELTFAVNVVATFVVTSLLLPLLLAQASTVDDVRIVIASSIS